MRRWSAVAILFSLAGACGYQHMNRDEISANTSFPKVAFQVTGMMKAKSGAT